MADSRYAGEAGLQAVFGQIKAAMAEKQDKINDMGLSHNDYSDTEKQKNAQNASDIVELNSDIDDIIEKRDGDATSYQFVPVVTVEDAVPGNVALRAKVEPTQDLHGYDKPWVGGANINNLFPCPRTAQTITKGGYTATTDGNGYYTITGSSSEFVDIYFDLDKDYTTPDGSTHTLAIQNSVVNNQIGMALYYNDTFIEQGLFSEANRKIHYQGLSQVTYNQIGFRLKGDFSNPLTMKPYIYFGNPSDNVPFSQWENICPIAKYDSCKITRTGKNLWNEKFRIGDFDSITGNEISGQYFCSKDFIGVIPNTDYYFYSGFTEARCYVYQYDKDKKYLGNSQYINFNPNTVFRTSSNAYYIKFLRGSGYSTVYRNDMSIIDADIEHKYYKYEGNDYQIELNGNTYYGKVRIDTQGNIYFDVDKLTVDIGTLNYIYNSTDKWFKAPVSNMKLGDVRTLTMLCECYQCIDDGRPFAEVPDSSIWNSGGASEIYIRDSRYTDPSDLATALDGMQLAYPIANPFTVALKDTTINLVKGQNTIYADTGDIEVTVNNTMDAIGSVQEQVNELASDKQDKTDNTLDTEAKTIVGAINEHEGDISQLKSGLNDVVSIETHTTGIDTASANGGRLGLTCSTSRVGYTAIGIVGIMFKKDQNTIENGVSIGLAYIDESGNVQISARNYTSNSITAFAKVYILYIKNV